MSRVVACVFLLLQPFILHLSSPIIFKPGSQFLIQTFHFSQVWSAPFISRKEKGNKREMAESPLGSAQDGPRLPPGQWGGLSLHSVCCHSGSLWIPHGAVREAVSPGTDFLVEHGRLGTHRSEVGMALHTVLTLWPHSWPYTPCWPPGPTAALFGALMSPGPALRAQALFRPRCLLARRWSWHLSTARVV